MATSSKKGRSAKDGDRKSSKKTDESSLMDDRKDESLIESIQPTPVEEDRSVEEENSVPPVPEVPPELIVYEEPPLTKLIVEKWVIDSYCDLLLLPPF